MTTPSWPALFSLEVVHDYFRQRACPVLRVVPCTRTAGLVARLGCVLRRQASGFSLHADHERLPALRLQARDADEPLAFTWRLHADDPLFGNYTDGLPPTADTLLYFDSRRAVADGATLRLHARDTVDAASGRDLCRLDDRALDGLLSARERLAPPLALVTLRVGRYLDALLADPPRVAPAYRLHFAARATVWKYCLLGPWDDDGLEIADSGREAEFDAPAGEHLASGEPALAIRSRSRIALHEQPAQRFQLVVRDGGARKVLIKRLPVAGARHLAREVVAGVPTLVSEIFVHR